MRRDVRSPRHRESGPATDGYGLEQTAADTTVADAAGAHEFVVLGFGMSAKFCQYLSLVDCGHEVPIEAPRELAALTEAFLAGRS